MNVLSEEEIFAAAIDLPKPERASFLNRVCAGNAALQAQVEALLAAHDRPDSLFSGVGFIPTVAAPKIAEHPGVVIGPYKLLEQIGEGGFGVVFMAEQQQPVRRKVALKVLKPGMDTRQVVARFEAERQALALMDHPHIAHVFDGGTTDTGRPYFVMELVRGVPITEFCDQSCLAIRQRLELFVDVCQAVQHAHQKGIIHRDIKPTNVMVTLHDGTPVVKVIDFGVAKALGQQLTDKTLFTNFAQMIGTPLYMSPEQAVISGLDVDTRSDIYSLGVLLYELLTGTTPFENNRLSEVGYDEMRRIIREEEPPKPSTRISTVGKLATTASQKRQGDPRKLSKLFRGELDWIVMKALEKDRNRRYETANGLASDVKRYLNDEQVVACPPSTAYKLRKFARKYRRLLWVAAAFALLLATATAVSAWLALRATLAEQTSTTALAQARRAENEAREAASQARAAEEESRKLLYATDMQLAPFVWKNDQSTAAQLRTVLTKHIPDRSAAVAKPDLRGFEWYYNQHLLERSAAIFSVPHSSVVEGVFTSNGQLLTLLSNGQLRRWDLVSQDEDEMSRRDLPGGAQVFVFSSDGRLAALAEGNKVSVFDTSAGEETVSIDSANEGDRLLCFSRGGDRLAVVDDKIRWCNPVTGEVIASFDRKFGNPRHLHLSADGLTLAVVGYSGWNNLSSIYRLDATANRVALLKEFRTATISGAALSPDGQRLVTSTWFGGELSVHDVATGQLIARHGAAHASRISAIAFSDDGTNLASADEEGTIKIWADAQGLNSKITALRTLKGHQGSINTVRFSVDGKHLLSCSWKRPWEHRAAGDRTVRVWDLENNATAFRPLEHCPRWGEARLSPDGLLIADTDGRGIHLWDAATGRLVRNLPAVDIRDVHSLAFSPTDNRLLAVGDNSQVTLWDVDAGEELARLPGATDVAGFTIKGGTGVVGALAFSTDGKYLVAGFGGRTGLPDRATNSSYPLKVWEVATRRLIHLLVGHTYCCSSLDFSRDGKLLASGGYDGKAMIWSTHTWKVTQTLESPTGALVYSTAFSPDGKTLTVGDERGNVQWWNVARGHLVETVNAHGTTVAALVFSPDGRTLASGGEDQTVRLWNVPTRRQLVQLEPASGELGLVQTLDFSPDGKQLLAGGTDSGGVWSAAPILWNDPDLAAEKLRLLLKSNADFKSRIRMFSENVRLHEALEKLDAKEAHVQAALAATQANWHASRHAWPAAVAAFNRLVASDPTAPEAWLRTPGVLRLATALVDQNRPAAAAALFEAGAKRQAQDPAASRAPGSGFVDAETAKLFSELQAATEKRLAETPRDAGLLELRGELAGQASEYERQVADYTAAIEALAAAGGEKQAAQLVSIPEATLPRGALDDLRRLYRRRGDAYVNLQKWREAVEDYAHVATQGTDADLLTKRARAYEALSDRDAAAADWLRAARQKPELAQSAYEPLIRLERWKEASQLGLMLIERTPDDSQVWLRMAAVLVLAGDQTAYAEFCGRMLRQFAESENIDDAERTVKACLLRPYLIDLGKPPAGKFTGSLDDGTAPQWFQPWGWCTRALLAWRVGDTESAVKYVARSEELKPYDVAHALNLAVLAMAQHQLQHPDEARRALDEASQLITRLRKDPHKKGDHDLLIAQILVSEAEAALKESATKTGR